MLILRHVYAPPPCRRPPRLRYLLILLLDIFTCRDIAAHYAGLRLPLRASVKNISGIAKEHLDIELYYDAAIFADYDVHAAFAFFRCLFCHFASPRFDVDFCSF